MEKLHRGIVLRANSEYKNSVTLLDEHQGKIEGLVFKSKPTHKLSHGMLISYAAKKSRAKYTLTDVRLLDMPRYWIGEHFLFFHHVLELADYFLPWDQQATVLFQLLQLLYTDPEMIGTKRSQKVFLYDFFRRLGMYPEEGLVPFNEETIESWLHACITTHSQGTPLHTMGFLKTLGTHEEAA